MSNSAHTAGNSWTVTRALQALRTSQKPPHGTPAYSRFVNRPLGRQLAARAVVLGLSPNQVSGLSALCSFIAIALVALGTPTVPVAMSIAVLLLLGYALDSADGQVARLTGLGSPFGEWLDHMIDCAKISALHLAVAIHVFRFSGVGVSWVLVPLLFLFVTNVVFFGMTLTDQLRRGAGADPLKKTGSLSVVRALVILPTDFGALCLVFVTLASPTLFLGLYSVMLAGSAAFLLAALGRWTRQLRAIGVAP